ncbi:MAG: N-acetyl-D-Glu racemase DgcA [Rhizobiaceae bacterium]
MHRSLSVAIEHYPIAGEFRIARGAKTEAVMVTCTIREEGRQGRGECVPYAHYGETPDGVCEAIAAMAGPVSKGIDRRGLLDIMPPGAARNAIDCAMWDLEARLAGTHASRFVCRTTPKALTTAFTISLGTPEQMARDARAAADRALLKIKLGGEGDPARMRAVAEAAPGCRIIADANEAWTSDMLATHMRAAADSRVELIEQPLPAGADDLLAGISRPVPVCADESAHVAADLDRLAGLYDAVNIKLDKAGGLTAAIAMHDKAKSLGMKIMIGCMVGTSLAMAPAVLLAQDADYVDLDGPLLLARDREPGLRYENSLVFPPEPALWG